MQENLSLVVIRGAETWQFFAFIFAAVLLLSYGLIDELPKKVWRVLLKVGSFLLVGYLTLLSSSGRDLLVQFLSWFKVDS